MFNLIALTVVGFVSSISFAQASAPQPTPTKTTTPSISYTCHFEDRDHRQDGRRQDGDIECKVEGLICSGDMASLGEGKHCEGSWDPIEVRCSNGFRLESKDAALSLNEGNLWINAEKRDHLVTLLVKDIHKMNASREEDSEFKAELLIANRVDAHLEGKCKFEREHDGRPLF